MSPLCLRFAVCGVVLFFGTSFRLAAEEVSAGSAPILLSLRAKADVGATGVFLDQVVVATSAGAVPHLLLAEAPGFGQTVSLSRTGLQATLDVQLAGFTLTNAPGADRVQVSRRSRSLEEEELKALLTASLREEFERDPGELELRFLRAWTALAVPADPIEVRILDVPASGLNSFLLVRFELWSGLERLSQHQVSLQARLWRDLPVARTSLQRGQLVRDADLVLERRDVLTVRDPLPAEALTDPNLEVAESVRAGYPLLARSVRVRPLIRRGRLIEAVLEDGPLSISLKVEALEDGLPGQTVRVRNLKTRREFLGKVQNEQTVVLAL